MQGWVFIRIYVFFIELTVFVLSVTNKNEEYKYDNDQGKKLSGWDKVPFYIYNIFGMITLLAAGLDSGRFKWFVMNSKILFMMIGGALFTLGSLIIICIRFANDYFGTVFITQVTQEGQTVPEKGTYKAVRHHRYIGMIITWIAMLFIFKLFLSIIPVAVILILFIIMTYAGDRVLIKEISQYKEYSNRTCYRLIPGIW